MMAKKPKPTAMQTEVMNKIHSGSVRMKPRIYFTILWFLGISSAVAAGLTFAYIINMAAYIIRIQTASTPAYGARQNLSESIASFPWWAVILSVTFSFSAIWLLRKYSRIYRYKISTVITIFVLSTLLLGLAFSFANIGHNGDKNGHSQDGAGRGYKLRQ